MIVLGENQAFNENQIIKIVRRYEGKELLSVMFTNDLYLSVTNRKLADELFNRLTANHTYMWRELKEYVWGEDFKWL